MPADASDLTTDVRALALTRESFVFDGLSLYYTVQDKYAERCLQGGVNAVNVTFAAETETWDEALRKIDDGLRQVERSPYMMQAQSVADLERARQSGKLAVVVGTQGASMLEDQPQRVRVLHRLGMRFFGLAYTGANAFADGCGELRDAGVSFLGRDLIDEVNDLRLLLDLSHCGHRTRAEAAELADLPVCTHSNAYALLPNDRNTRDETARVIAAKGGVIGLCTLPRSLEPGGAPTMAQFMAHARHWQEVIGLDHLGLGFDFVEGYVEARREGASYQPPKWRKLRPDIFGDADAFFSDRPPQGFESIRLLPNLTEALLGLGLAPDAVRSVLGENWLRAFRRTEG